MDAVICACGRRLESDTHLDFADLLTEGHDPDECSRQVGFQGRFNGRAEMVDAVVAHLGERESMSGAELFEIRQVLSASAATMPLGSRSVSLCDGEFVVRARALLERWPEAEYSNDDLDLASFVGGARELLSEIVGRA